MSEIVEAALRSTRAYLEFLATSERGFERHPASLAGVGVPEPRAAGGKTWLVYRFQAERRLRLSPDTVATYAPEEGDGKAQEVLVHGYDPRTGFLELGFERSHASAGGMLEINFRWLVERVEKWLEDRGSKIVDPAGLTRPARAPTRDEVAATLADPALFPTPPSASQVEAIQNAIASPFSYTWGPPGSGKTDYALSGAAAALVGRGLRVLVLAPTNLAMENALRAILRRFQGAGRDVSRLLRLGLPTPEFLRDHPGHCEDHSIRAEVDALLADLAALRDRQERFVERAEIERELEAIAEIGNKSRRKNSRSKTLGIAGPLPEIRDALRARLAELGPAPEGDTAEGLEESIDALERKVEGFAEKDERFESRLADLQVTGLTLDGFVGMSGRGIKADWILVDEAAYAPIAKVLPLLSLKAPIALFGDHRQLPPVCESDGDDAEIGAYWGQSAIHLETAWRHPESFARIASEETPPFESLKLSSITESFRFDDAFAKILDEFVYGIGLRGRADRGTEIVTVEVEPERSAPGEKRTSPAEARAVIELLAQTVGPDEVDRVVVLTPYKNQAKLIRLMLRQRRGYLQAVEVLNTHRAQGREWDTVIFSAVDGSRPLCRPYFTDSRRPAGKVVVNTTLSRVRRRLVLVVEKGFWTSRPDQLLGRLAILGASR